MIKGQLSEQSKDEINAEALRVEAAIVKIFDEVLAGIKVDVFEGSGA